MWVAENVPSDAVAGRLFSFSIKPSPSQTAPIPPSPSLLIDAIAYDGSKLESVEHYTNLLVLYRVRRWSSSILR